MQCRAEGLSYGTALSDVSLPGQPLPLLPATRTGGPWACTRLLSLCFAGVVSRALEVTRRAPPHEVLTEAGWVWSP